MKRFLLILVLLIAVTSSYAQRGITGLKLIEAKKVTTDTLEYRGEQIDFADLKSRAKFVGDYDLSVGSFPAGSHVGSMYELSVDGTVNDTLYHAGDILISIKENASISVYGGNWLLIDNSDNGEITGNEAAFTGWDKNASDDFSGNYNDLTNKPTAFTPAAHSHTESEITDLDHYTDADIDGTEAAFAAWDKNASDDLALGETSGTAYRGDRGKTAYDHSLVVTGNPHAVTKTEVGLGNVDNTSDAGKPVSTLQQAALDLKVDKVTGKALSTEDYTTSEKSKLAGVAAGANNYTHPATHSPSIIMQDANNRFVTDVEKSTWNGKQNILTNPVTANVASFTEKRLVAATGSGNQVQETGITVNGIKIGINTANPIHQFVVSNAGALGLEINPESTGGTLVDILSYDRLTSSYKPIRINAYYVNFDIAKGLYVGYDTDPGFGSKLAVNGPAYFEGSLRATHGNQFFSTTNSSYGTSIIGTPGGARSIFSVGQSGFSNGFTVDYDGSKMLYTMNNGSLTAMSFITTGGTSAQFLKADGSVDSNTYLTSFTETDPIFSAWNKSTGISITKSQISDFPTNVTQLGSGSATLGQIPVANGSGGLLFATPSLEDLSDVEWSGTKLNDQLLRFNSSTSKWYNWTPNFLTSEADPAFSAWNKSTGITITQSQITDLDHYTDADIDGTETAFTGWDKDASNDFSGSWNNLTDIPAGFADGIDNVDVQDNAVTYNKLANEFKRKSTVTSSIDLSADAIGSISLSANTTFTFSNLQVNKTYTIIVDTNGYTPTFPAYCTKTTGSLDVLGDYIYYIDFRCFSASSGSEEILYTVFHRKNP